MLHGQAPLISDQLVAPKAGEAIALDWRVDAADRALSSGLVGLAESGYRAVLKTQSLSPDRADPIRVRLAAALIAQQRYSAAREEIDAVSTASRDSQFYLYMAIAVYGDGKQVDRSAFLSAMKQVKPVQLDAYDTPWWHLANGLRAELLAKPGQIMPAFERAVAAAKSAEQKAFFSSLVFRQKILETPADEGLAAEMREQLEQFAAQAAAYTYARQYAVILHNLGRSEEAISVIDEQRLNNKELVIRQREQLLLLKAMIAGPDSLRGIEALQQLVRNGKSLGVMRVALQLLARSSGAATGGLTEFLDQMVKLAPPHPLLGEIYYISSQLALARAEKALEGENPNVELARAETARAEKDAAFLLEQFPGLRQITNVYRLLAYAAIQRTTPRYRAAADFLIQLRDQTEVMSERALLNRLIGDCYFLNRDYDNAVDFYQAAYARSIDGDQDKGLFLRLVTAEVRSGQVESAMQHIDEADFSGNATVSDLWRAEWNVAQTLKNQGKLEQALERVRLLLDGAAVDVPTALDLRLSWLEVHLSFWANETDATLLERVIQLLARVESIPVELLDKSEADQITEKEIKLLITQFLLLKAQVMIRSAAASEGLVELERLRVGYADSSAAQRSYLTEADYHASINDFSAAQETLTELASTYPQSVLAPQAIFEAAIYCERRGAEFYEQAVLLHNQIAENYPSDELVYSARLKQGDLLRRMNDFAGAQIIYENLINTGPRHPRRYIPELSRVDCMLALAKNNDEQLSDVVLSLERLMDIPNMPIDFQAEVGFKWGFALLKRELPEQAKEVFLLISSRFLLDGEQAIQLGSTGRYWMSRAMLSLGSILEDSDQLVEARRVYRKMVAFNLPGRNLALDRANTIQVVEEPVAQ